MSKSFPYLAMDSAGKRTILCDYPVPMFGDKADKETTKVTKTMSIAAAPAYGKALAARLVASDSALGDETVEKLKAFLKSKLTAEDHEAVCNLLAGDVEAQDTDPPPDDGPRLPGTPRPGRGMDSLSARQLSMQAADGAASFAAMFPDAARIKVL